MSRKACEPQWSNTSPFGAKIFIIEREHILIDQIISALPEISNHHARGTKIYKVLEKFAGQTIKDSRLTSIDGGI